jgi:hypothetical protein
VISSSSTHASSDDHGQFCHARAKETQGLVAVVATLSKGYDLDYIWKHVGRGPAKDAASYYIQASESGGEPTQQRALSTSGVKEHWRPLTGSAALDGGTRPLREPVPPGSAAAQGSFGCV